MTDQQKIEFTRRISQSNRTQLVVITYEILFVYLEDARQALQENQREAYKESLRKAQNALERLMETLDFKYEIAKELYPLYLFSRRRLALAQATRSAQEISEVQKVLQPLYKSFVEVAKQDQSEPLMKNTQQVYAGITYGKTDLNESYGMESNRGFYA